MNNWKTLTFSNEKYKKVIIIAFLVLLYMIQFSPISNLCYLLEDLFENYNENGHTGFASGMYYTFKIYDAEEFMTFVYDVILSALYVAVPLFGVWAAYFGKKFYVYITEGILFLFFILACIGNAVQADEYDYIDITPSADVWFILIGIAFVLVLLLADSNVISFNKAPKQINMNQHYGYNQPYNGYNQPQMNNQYMAQNPQMNGYMENGYDANYQMNQGYAANPQMAGFDPNAQMNGGYAPNPQMDNAYAPQDQMYNGFDPNNGGN